MTTSIGLLMECIGCGIEIREYRCVGVTDQKCLLDPAACSTFIRDFRDDRLLRGAKVRNVANVN